MWGGGEQRRDPGFPRSRASPLALSENPRFCLLLNDLKRGFLEVQITLNGAPNAPRLRPSCNTRRMARIKFRATHLSDHLFPCLPVRQWVLSVPKRLRYFMQRDGPVLDMVLRIFLRVIGQTLQPNCLGAANVDNAALYLGAVAFIHRFGSSLNEHVHFHVCAVDGVF